MATELNGNAREPVTFSRKWATMTEYCRLHYGWNASNLKMLIDVLDL